MNMLTIAYWVGLLIEVVIRAPFQKAARSAEKTDRPVPAIERVLLGLLAVSGLLLPLVYSVTGWLDFANYSLPAWMGWLGLLLLVCALYLFARAHRDLKTNWSPTLEIYEDHTLVTGGIYEYIRHPMYASQWVWVIAQVLLLQNWLAGPAGLLVFIPFYFLRVPAEEKMMLETFGEQYRQYRDNTGAVLPRF